MNRNVESHFAENPTSLDVSRSMFDRSSSVKFSANVGELIPFYIDEVLPGDTFNIETSKVVRLQTMLTPIMDNMYLDTYFFFVPNRLVWDHWKQFCGESNKAWLPTVEYTVPQISVITHPGVGSLMDYMGIHPGVLLAQPPFSGINALPFRAYAKICDDWFRSEALTDPLVIPTGDSTQAVGSKSDADIYCANGGPVFHACKYHDYFTSCLPAPQCGPTTKIPVSGTGVAPVGTLATENLSYHSAITGWNSSPLHLTTSDSHSGWVNAGFVFPGSYPKRGNFAFKETDESTEGATLGTISNLYADTAMSVGTINDLRIAFQVQKFYEKMSRGRRYIEVLKSQFGVTSPDARLQRSEYLGGNRIPLNVHEVLNNSKADNAFLGDLGGMSRSVDVHSDFVHSFTEHGFVIGVCVVRYDHTYGQGIERFYQRRTIFDYYWPVFANLGEQAVKLSEIYFMPTPNQDGEHTGVNRTFGYQEAWADYRYKPSRVAGEMRPGVSGSLASWHLADYYSIAEGATPPSLSDSWIREDPANVNRCLAVTSDVSNQYFADIFIKNICTRVMPMYSIPGLADHH